MKTFFLNELRIIPLACLVLSNVQAQISIGPGSGTINPSASLEVISGPYPSGSPYRGLLPPTVTIAQRGQIQNPAKGLVIFNTSTNRIEVNTGTTTTPVWTSGATAWSLTGNAGTTSDNFLGTTDNVPLRLRVNNQNAGRIDQFLSNVGLGYLALNDAATGQGNTAVGHRALSSISNSNFNTAMGLQSLEKTTTGSGNTGVGFQTLYSNTTSSYNTATGFRVLANNTTGFSNTASGFTAMLANTEGFENTAFGAVALTSNTTGNHNTAIGAGALGSNTTGTANTGIGHNAFRANTTGYANVGVGEDALINNISGHDNVALGTASLVENTTGGGNMASGNLALSANTTGNNNTGSGLLALRYNTTGSYNTALGYDAGSLAATPGITNSTAIGANAKVGASNTIVLGDNNITSLRCNVQTISSLSDKRIKEDINPNVPGLKFITKLTPVTYHVNKFKEAELVGYAGGNVIADKVLHSGFLAQDVEAAAQSVGYDFEGVRREEGGKYYTLGYTLFVMPLVQAVKELNAEINQLKAELMASKENEKAIAARLDKIEALLKTSTLREAVTFKP